MIVLRKEQQRRPFGGHHFPEQGMVVRGENLEELVEKVSDLRIGNNHPLGDPERDILRYYAEHFPFMVRNSDEPEPEKEVRLNFVKWCAWVRTIWKNPPKRLISSKESAIRWESCKACPRNVKKDWPRTDECKDIERRAFMLRCGLDVPRYLGYCECHRSDLGVFSYMHDPAKFSNKEKMDKQPEGCWVGNLMG